MHVTISYVTMAEHALVNTYTVNGAIDVFASANLQDQIAVNVSNNT